MAKSVRMDKHKNKSKLWLALKFLQNRSVGPIGRAHYLTVAGILLGVTALLCVSSVMNGFRADIRDRIIGSLSEIRISAADGNALAEPYQVADRLRSQGFKAAPVIRNELVLKRGGELATTLCFGIDPALQAGISGALMPQKGYAPNQPQGMLAGNIQSEAFAAGGIALGSALAMKLGVTIGDEVQLLSPIFTVPTAFGMIPRVRTLKVAGIFSAGMPDYDLTFSYVPLDVARFFSGYGDEADYVEVKTPDFDRSEAYARSLRKSLAGYRVDDWSSFDASLYSAIRFEKYLMFVLLLFMYVIASFNLTGNMLKAIVQKKRELGLLQALGYTEPDLRGLFLRQSLILSTLGIVGGLLLASLLLWLQLRFGIIRLDIGDIQPQALPVRVFWQDYLLVVLASYGITILSVILPLRRLKNINVIELIRQTA